ALRGDERNLDAREATLLRDFDQARHHAVLHAAAEGTAAQQECVYVEGVSLLAEDHDSGEAIAAEAIGDFHGEALLAGERLNLGFAAPAARGVHLVGPLGELCDAGDVTQLERRDANIELERSQELFEAGGGALGSSAPGALGVQLGPAAVFFRDA